MLTVLDVEEIEQLTRMDILEPTQDQTIRAKAKIFPYKTLNLFCDFRSPGNQQDVVYTPGGDSTKLAEVSFRMPFGSALDLCTGTGIQAILAAQHCEQVTAIDISPRAAYFTRLNLALNEINQVNVSLGHLYEPVESATFDFITANPPFVTSPTQITRYRDGGVRGDEVLMQILNGLPHHLKDGGFCQIVTHLYEFEDLSHIEYIRTFAEENRYETLLFLTPAFDKYALTMDQFATQITNYDGYKKQVTDYLTHLDRMKFEKGYMGIITFRNSDTYNFKKMTTLHRPVSIDFNNQEKLKQFYGLD